jgi:RNA polymerase sigma factor (sigma-70 family)
VETTRGEPILGPIRLLFEVGTVAGMSDGQLLDRFLARRGDEEAAEVAFAALVERHGPMVLRACRARLGDEHDAQDAFQATFLILARKAGAIRQHESAASWLHGVARRVASCARRAAAVRRAKERKAAGGKADFVAEGDRSDLVPTVREEVGDLPEKYRTPLMLCLLDGLTHEEAATRLGWPVGTVKTRVRRAKDRLRVALTRRGLAPSLGAIGAALAAREASAMPATLVRATARAALGFELGRSSAFLSASVAKLVELGIGSLIMTRLKIIGLVVASIGVLAAGATTGLARQDSKPQEKQKPAEARPAEKAVDAPRPVAAEVAEEDVLDQLEMAKIAIEVHRMDLENLRKGVIQCFVPVESSEANLKTLRLIKDMEELKNWGEVQEREDFDAAKKRIEKDWGMTVDQAKERLKWSRAAYADRMRVLRRDEQRLKELEARAASAGSSPGPKGPAHVGGPDQEALLERVNAAAINLELIQMDVDQWTERFNEAHRAEFELDREFHRHSASRARGESKAEAAERDESLTLRRRVAVDEKMRARNQLMTLKQDLFQKERQLRDLAKDLPEPLRLEALGTEPVASRDRGPRPADVDHRLSDVERKLDLILKALEKQGREPEKE